MIIGLGIIFAVCAIILLLIHKYDTIVSLGVIESKFYETTKDKYYFLISFEDNPFLEEDTVFTVETTKEQFMFYPENSIIECEIYYNILGTHFKRIKSPIK